MAPVVKSGKSTLAGNAKGYDGKDRAIDQIAYLSGSKPPFPARQGSPNSSFREIAAVLGAGVAEVPGVAAGGAAPAVRRAL